ncbi:hypothetical protein HK405_002588, partial [Cladochytrium tenue]
DDSGYTYYYNDEYDNSGVANPYYNATLGNGNGAHLIAGCTDLLECTLDATNNQVYSVLAGSAVAAGAFGATDATKYTHHSILKTLELNWDLGNLGQLDVDATPFDASLFASSHASYSGSAVVTETETETYTSNGQVYVATSTYTAAASSTGNSTLVYSAASPAGVAGSVLAVAAAAAAAVLVVVA